MIPLMTKARIVSAAIALFAVAPSAAYAAGTPDQHRACRQDAMTFCRAYVPNVKRITVCMERNFRKLSPACRKQFR